MIDQTEQDIFEGVSLMDEVGVTAMINRLATLFTCLFSKGRLISYSI